MAEGEIQLSDGARVAVRPIEAGDREAIREAFGRLSAETRYRRFLTSVERLSESELRYLTDVDHTDHEALVAYDPDTGDGIAVARFIRDPGRPTVAEAAVVVGDDWQSRGLGTELCRMLAERAREVGVEAFTATLLAENQRMIHVLESLGRTRVVSGTGGTITVELAIPSEGIGETMRELLRSTAKGLARLRIRR